MARKSQTHPRLEDARHVLVAVALGGGVLGTLLLGAALRVDPAAAHGPRESASTPTAAPTAALAAPLPPAAELSAAPEAAAGPEDPSAAPADEWTLQFMVTCKADVAARVRAQLAGDDWLLVTDHVVAGQRCHRISWGRFATADEARAARRDAPAVLGELTPEPLIRRRSELLP